MHKEAMMSAKRNSKGISAQLHSAHLAAQLFHRKMLLKVLCTFQYLSRQGFAFRGHKEDIESLKENCINCFCHTQKITQKC